MIDPTPVEPALSSGSPEACREIARVIHTETLAFQNEDYDAWKVHWTQDDRTRDIFISSIAGLSVISGWAAISGHMKRVFETGLSDRLIEFRQQNMQISVSGDVAWVVFETHSVFESGITSLSFDTRILERDDGQWRFVYASFVLRQDTQPEGLSVGLDDTGRIVQSSPAALDALKDHPILTVSHGRVRAHRRDWDRTLQAALEKAGHHHGFFETHKFTRDTRGTADYPVILGQTDEGGVAVAHLSIRDCMTFIRIDADQVLESRLGFAQTVFGISDGQINVARQIALGKSLKQAADVLGISANTARTHLTRLFEKTGVSTQAALVRLLLSVG